ncbi:hypothetical protein ABZ815_49090 [Nonomuraea sp. NPDC047529]|uniref:hypothetical protein n=1 Tax=Nonomuraea sp. NPDC047529 TaxID=3155623 RepID=UPI0033EA4B0C
MSVVTFPGQPDSVPDSAIGSTTVMTTMVAVERFLDSLTTVTTRVGHAETLARLTAVAGPAHPVAALTPEHYAAVMAWPQMWVERARLPASSMMSAVVASSSMSWSTHGSAVTRAGARVSAR